MSEGKSHDEQIAAKGYRWLTPRELAKRRCRARIDGRHEWVYVGGGKYRCAGCGAE